MLYKYRDLNSIPCPQREKLGILYSPVFPELERQRQLYLWSFLGGLYDQVSELQVEWDTLSH